MRDGTRYRREGRVMEGQIGALGRKDRLVPGDGVLFAHVPYSSTLGLDLTFSSQDDA